MTTRPPSPRPDGFAPIESYAVLGDGRTVALVADDGSIDWWPIPTLDSPPILAALLAPDGGGRFALAPSGPYAMARHYVEGTNVLQTTYRTAEGTARVTEALNTGRSGRLPWTELARRVEGLAGRVEFAWSFEPGDRFGTGEPHRERFDGRQVTVAGDQQLAVVADVPVEPAAEGAGDCGIFTVEAGERRMVCVVATDHEPLPLPAPDAVQARLDRTVAQWRDWSSDVILPGRWQAAVMRSALALKTLVLESSGAIAAAATTSLPEQVGGPKNWDYRYAWVRDSSFTLDALINLGLEEEVHRAMSWLMSALRTNGGRLHVLYSLDASLPSGETQVDVAGWHHSRPVRHGNSASGQIQLGVYGDLFDTVYRYAELGHRIDSETGLMLGRLADRCAETWRGDDSGIWELPDPRPFTVSKMGCWVALDRAWRLAEDGQLPSATAARWRDGSQEIHDWVEQNCWSEAKGCWTEAAGSGDLDAAVLLAGRTGFDRGPRLSRTADAVRAELGRGCLLYRYTGMDREEGAFVACTFWLVEALAHVGRLDEAIRLMDEAVEMVSDLGLLSEQIEPTSGAFLGNTPQGLSHLALINAAFTIDRAVQR